MKKPCKAVKPVKPLLVRLPRDSASDRGPAWDPERPKGAIACNPAKIKSSSTMPDVPLWYVDTTFVCRDCRSVERWTASQQYWWYEIAGGDIETTAVRCRACRRRKRAADAAATRRTREHRQARAQKRAAALAEKLAAAGPDGFAVLDAPLRSLDLPQRVESVLLKTKFRTVGDLVALQPGECLPGLRVTEMRRIRTLLERHGLTLLGATVPRPR